MRIRQFLLGILAISLLSLPAAAQEIKGQLRASLEIWPTSVDSFQHRMDWQADIAAIWSKRIRVAGGYRMVWWGHHYSNIPGNFQNAETGFWLERDHEIGIDLRIGPCWIGPYYDRVATVSLMEKAIWGQTLGYHDHVRGRASCYLKNLQAVYQSPGVYNDSGWFLPYPAHIIDIQTKVDKVLITAHGEYKGIRNPAGHVIVEYSALPFKVGMLTGWLARPDWNVSPVFFVGTRLTLQFGELH